MKCYSISSKFASKFTVSIVKNRAQMRFVLTVPYSLLSTEVIFSICTPATSRKPAVRVCYISLILFTAETILFTPA